MARGVGFSSLTMSGHLGEGCEAHILDRTCRNEGVGSFSEGRDSNL